MARSPFAWGGNTGERLTPRQVEQRRVANALMQREASQTTPVAHWSAGINRALQGWLSGREAGAVDAAERSGIDSARAAVEGSGVLGPNGAVASALGGAPSGDPGGFLGSLIKNESGGNWNALNDEGYGGRLQFGDARLVDAARAGIIPAGVTGAAFSQMTPEQQMAVENWHFGDIDRQAEEMGLLQYIGQNIGGVPVTRDAIRSMAHLGGIGGAAKFLQSGGAYNPADSNGTSLRDYGMRHGGGVGTLSDVAAPASGGISSSVISALMADPWVAQEYGAALSPMLQRAGAREDAMFDAQLRQSDPMYQAQLGQLLAPKPVDPWAGIKEFGGVPYRMGEGGAEAIPGIAPPSPSAQSAIAKLQADLMAGLITPEQYAIGEENISRGSGVTVNLGSEGQRIGSIPPGMAAVTDPANPSGFRFEAIPGGPAAAEAAAKAEKDQKQQDLGRRAGTIVMEDIDRAIEQAGDGLTTGFGGSWISGIPGTAAHDLQNTLRTIRSNVGFDRLQQMRDASPTGGALGSVSERELTELQSVLGSLEQSQTQEQLMYNLRRFRQVYGDIMKKFDAYPGQPGYDADISGRSSSPSSAPSPVTIGGYTIEAVE